MQTFSPFFTIDKPSITTATIKGEHVYYDACSSGNSLRKIKRIYHAFDYIGSGQIYHINGKHAGYNKYHAIHHFFVCKKSHHNYDPMRSRLYKPSNPSPDQ